MLYSMIGPCRRHTKPLTTLYTPGPAMAGTEHIWLVEPLGADGMRWRSAGCLLCLSATGPWQRAAGVAA